jgi:hypothetical protein
MQNNVYNQPLDIIKKPPVTAALIKACFLSN